MGIESKTVSIDGRSFIFVQLPAFRAQRLLIRLLRVGGPALGSAVSAGMAAARGGLGAIDVGALAPVVASLFEKLTPEEYESLLRELLEGVRMDGKELLPQFDIAMAGRPLLTFRLLAESITHNFRDFSDALAGFVSSGAAAGAASDSSSPTT